MQIWQCLYLKTTDTLRRIWWSSAVCASFSLRSCPVSFPSSAPPSFTDLFSHKIKREFVANFSSFPTILVQKCKNVPAEFRYLLLQLLDLGAVCGQFRNTLVHESNVTFGSVKTLMHYRKNVWIWKIFVLAITKLYFWGNKLQNICYFLK